VAYTNLAQMFFTRAGELGDRPRYRFHDGTAWRDVSWATMADRVRSLAAAFIEQGVRPGERVALLSATRPEWMEVDLAILRSGGRDDPRSIIPVLPDECGYILANAGAERVVVENAKQRAKVCR
jgi:long-chain acyl-CoA synthetase